MQALAFSAEVEGANLNNWQLALEKALQAIELKVQVNVPQYLDSGSG